MKIGLYFGSFNPIHIGHLIIANNAINNTPLQQVWLVVSPQNPLKQSASLLNEYNRLHLIQLAIEGEIKLRASDIEFQLPRPSYTIDTLVYLIEKYPKNEFSIIMGSDSLANLHKWKNYQIITANYPIYVYERQGFEINNAKEANVIPFTAPVLPISSTLIRTLIKQGKSIRYLVPDKVMEEIERNQYYK